MAGESDIQGPDDPRNRDANAPKRRQQAPDPGRTTNTDTQGVSPNIPGKRTNTDGMAADGAAGPGKSTQVDAHEGGEGKTETRAGAGGGGGGGGGKDETKDADHAGAVDAKTVAGPGGAGKKNAATGKDEGKDPVAAKGKKKDDGAAAGPPVKEAVKTAAATPGAQPAQRVDAGEPATVPTLTVAPPRPNKNLSDKWQKETGRTVEQHHEQIVNALTAVQADVSAKQAELMQLVDTEITKATSDITAKVASFQSSLVAPGRARVESAYAGLGKGFEQAEQKAIADIAKQKTASKALIETAKKANGDGISKKLGAAKATVDATIQKNVPLAAASIKKWAGGIPQWVQAAKTQAKTSAEAVAKNFNPGKGNASSIASGLVALSEDVKKNHTIKHGEKLGKQYESALVGWSKDTDKKADELVRKALDESKAEFEAALGTADQAAKKGFEEATKNATTTVDSAETNAKKSVTDARQNGVKRFQDEKKASLEHADKAAKDFSDNTSGAGTELTDRIKKKANDDSKGYAAIVTGLQSQFNTGKPMQFEQAQPKIDSAKDQLLKLHQSNTDGLKKFITDGTGQLTQVFSTQQGIYERAIKDREEMAKKTDAEVLKDISKGAETMSASVANIGKSFSDITEQQGKRVDQMIVAFNQNADTATKDFGNKITEHLETSRKGLEDNLKANLEPAKIQEDTQGPIAQEIQAKAKSIDTDTGTLRNAMDGWGTDEGKIYAVLRKLSAGELTYLEASYQNHYPQRAKNGMNALRADLDDELNDGEQQIAFSYLNGDRAKAVKLELADSTGFFNDDEARIADVLKGCSEEELKNLNSDPASQKVVADVKSHLSGADLDLMNTLLDTSIDKDDRKVKADAIELFQTMDGLGTDEAKMQKILSEAKTEEERAKLRQYFNQYATSKGWDGGDGKEGNDALTLAIKDDVGTGLFGDDKGEQNKMLSLASVKRDEDDVKAAKMVEGADGAGTNEDAIFEALDDEEYAKKWAAASPEDRKKLEEARRKMLDAKVAKMSGGKWDSAQGLIDDEMSKSKITYGEFLAGKREDGTPVTAEEKANAKKGEGLQWMVAQRKLQTGQAEPELMLAYACWGVTGTDEDTIKKVLGPEPKPIAEVKALNAKFASVWGRPLVSHIELENMKGGAPSGLLADELSGKDWFSVRMLMAGKPETAEQLKYISDQKAKFNKGGAIANALMTVGEAVGYTEAKSTADATEKRFNEEYQQKFGKNPTAKLGTADSKELEQLADYLSQDYEAYSASLNALVDGIVTALEIVGGVIITVVTAGTASPVLAAVIANLVLSAGTITFKYAALGDQYGAAELAADVVKAVGTSAFAGLGELKALQNVSNTVGNKVAGGVQKLSQLANEAAGKAGMKMAKNGALEMGQAATQKLSGIVAAGTKNVILGAGQEVYGALTDEKTYDKKFGEAIWGEDSVGAKILKGIPKSFAEGAVTQWINESAGTSNKDNAGHSTGPKSNALTNAIADMGGATAGFFVYVDNYKDAEQFWMQLLKTNANKAVSGAMNGYAMHKTRAKKLGRDFINGDMLPEGLVEMAHSMDASEIKALAQFVEKYAPEKAALLPDAYKQHLANKGATTPAANTNTGTTAKPANTNAGETESPGGSVDSSTETKPKSKGEDEKTAVAKTTDEADAKKAAAPAAGSKEEELAAKKGAGGKTANADEEKDPTKPAKPLKDEEEKKPHVEAKDESAVAADAKKVQSDKETESRIKAEQRQKEVEAARAATAERDKQLVEEIHGLAPAAAVKPKTADGKDAEGPQAPLDVHKVFDNITLGAGFAGVANMASRPGGEDSIMIAAGGNPWDKAKNRFGQPVGASEVPNAQAGHTMKETVSDPNAKFMQASEHADNVALNKNDHQMRTYPGASGAAEAKDPATWPKWALESGANVRIPVTGPDGVVRYFYAKQVDVAVGPGPARQLPESVLDAETLKKMKDGKAFFLGDQSFTGDEIKAGDHVAAFGGGASAAWGVEASSKNAASVEWIARVPDKQKRDDLQAKLKGLQDEVKAARASKDPARIEAADRKMQEFTFTEAERNGYLPRNTGPGGAFDPKKQADQPGGNISRRGIEHLKKVEYVEHEGKMQVKMTFLEDHHPEGPREVVVYKDKMILSIGQDAGGPGGPVNLVKQYEGKLQPIYGEPDKDGFKPIVGVQSADGSLRILGAAATPNEISHMLEGNTKDNPAAAKAHQANLEQQAAGLSADSKGVVGGFELAQKHIEAANRQLGKKIQEDKEAQRRSAGLDADPEKGALPGGKPKNDNETETASATDKHADKHGGDDEKAGETGKKVKPAGAETEGDESKSGTSGKSGKVLEPHEEETKKAAASRIAQEENTTRHTEIHIHDDTPAKPMGPTEQGLRGELDSLWKLRGKLRKATGTEAEGIQAQIKAAQDALDVKLKDPKFKDSLLDPHVAFALAREAGTDSRSQGLHDFLRTNVDAFRKAQDQARQGNDPELRAKREVFEREVAKLVLAEGPVKKAVDGNLDDMCLKAIDYILKSRKDHEQNQAFADLGQQADSGYAGAVLQGKDVNKNAKDMGDVLLNGNVRERMIALGKFSEMVANDMLFNPAKFEEAAAKSANAKPGEFSAADAKAFKDRMNAFLKDRGWKEGDPLPSLDPVKDKDYGKDFLKPTSGEKSGAQSEYQGHKSQDMDTKLPSMTTTPVGHGAQATDDFFSPGPLPENKKTPGMTGAGESSTLARTSISLAEAQYMGYQLSPREIEIAKANGGKLPWVVGTVANVVDPSAKFIADGANNSLPQKAGISGTTFRFMEASQLLGGDPALSRLAMVGALQTIDAHTVYEISSASKGFGLGFDPKRPYDTLGIDRPTLEQIALKTGTTYAELNGESQDTPAKKE